MGIAGVWLSIAIDLAVRAGFLFMRFSKKLRPKEQVSQLKGKV
jgi:Na+-driven multidrug efflux pump